MKKQSLLIAIFLLTAAHLSYSATWSVPGDFATLPAAIAGSGSNDTINVYSFPASMSGMSVTSRIIRFIASSGSCSLSVENCRLKNTHVEFYGEGTAACTANVQGNDLNGGIPSNTWPSVFILVRDTASMNLAVSGNTISNLVDSDAIVARAMRNGSVLSGEISGNTIVSAGTNAYDRGIWVDVNPSPMPGPRGYIQVNNNSVHGAGGSGIKVRVMNNTNRWTWCAMDMLATDNYVVNAARASSGETGIYVEVGTALGSYGELWLNLRGNAGQGIKLAHGDGKNAGRFVVPGVSALLAQTNNWPAQVHVQSYNTATVTVTGLVRVGGLAADTFTGKEDTNLLCTIFANEYDMRGARAPLRVTSVGSPLNGSAVIGAGSTNVVYTPFTNFYGTDSFAYIAGNGLDWTGTATVYVTITPVNDPPSFTNSVNPDVNEDSGLNSMANWATNISVGPANESSQTQAFTVVNTFPGLFSIQPAVSSTGTLTFTPAANLFGTATGRVWCVDSGGTANGGRNTSTTQSFVIVVNSVNDAPTFSKGLDEVKNEDSGLSSTNWAGNISPGPSDEAGQILNFIVTNDNPTLFSSQPSINPTGTLTYALAANANGIANVAVWLHDDGGTNRSGKDTSAPANFTVTVTPINDAPTDIQLSENTLAENMPAATVVGLFSTTDIDAGDTQVYTLVAGAGAEDNAYFTATNGQLKTATVLNFENKSSYSIRVRSTDSGGLFVEETFTILVTDVNDAPVAQNDSYAFDEDTLFVTNAPGILGNDFDEDGDSTTIANQTAATNGTLTLHGDGSFEYQPAANFHGTDSFTYHLVDDGVPAQTSALATVTLTVNPVIDAPVIVWTNPVSIVYGVPLSGVHLNATADVAGTFTYLPTNGTIMNAGTNVLHADFVPDDSFNFSSGTVEVSLVVFKADQTITFPNPGDQVATNRLGLSPSAGSGLPVTLDVFSGPGTLSDGTNLTFTGEGQVALRAVQPGDTNWNEAVTVTNAFNVTRAVASVEISNLLQTYDDSAKDVAVQTGPTGLTAALTYDGNAWAPTNAGSYTVTATVVEVMYQGSATATLVVAKADQAIAFPNPGNQFWTNRVGLAATSGSGLTVSFAMVTGPAAIPEGTNLSFTGYGEVLVSASQSGDANWNAAPVVTNSLESLGPVVYGLGTNGAGIASGDAASADNGTDYGAAIIGLQSFTNTFGITNSGTADLIISGVTTNGSASFMLQNVPVTLPAGGVAPFQVIFAPVAGGALTSAFHIAHNGTGAVFVLNVAGTGLGGGIALDTNILSFSAVYAGTDPAVQVANLSNVGISAFTFTNVIAYSAGASGWLTVSPAAGTVPVGEGTALSNRVDVSGINAGIYSATVAVTAVDATNSPQIFMVNLSVATADQAIAFPTIADQLTTNLVGLSASASSGLTVGFVTNGGPALITGGTNLSFTGTGVVSIVASQTGDTNWNSAADVTNTFTVTKALAGVTLTNLNQTYNGTARSAGYETVPAGLTVRLTCDGNDWAPTNAGSYTVTGVVDDVMWQGSATGTLVVARASQTIIFPALADQLTTNLVGLSAAASSGLAVSFVTNGGPAVITGGTNLSFTGTGVISIVASQAGDANWNAAPDVANTFTVTKALAAVTLNNLNQTYDGTARIAGYKTVPASLTVLLTYGGNAWAPTNAGSYAVTGTVDDVMWQGWQTGTLIVVRALDSITFANTSHVYDGTAKTVTVAAVSDSPVTVTYNGSATAPVNVGVYSVTGVVDAANWEATNITMLTLSKSSQTITFDPIADPLITNRVGLSAAASSGLAVILNANGPIVLAGGTNLTFTGTGLVSIVASQAGNSNFLQAASVTNSFMVYPLKPWLSAPFHLNGAVTSALMGATIDNVFGANASERGIAWGLVPGFDPAAASRSEESGIFGSGTWTQQVNGLSAGLTNYFRAYAVNTAGTGYTVQAWVLMRPVAPMADDPSNFSFDSFLANWQTVAGAWNYIIDVSEDAAFGIFVPGYQGRNAGNVSSITITGLVAGVTYHYRVRGENDAGRSDWSEAKTAMPVPLLTLVCLPETGGTTTPAHGSLLVNFNVPVDIEAQAHTGYAFVRWDQIGGGTVADPSAATTTVTLVSNSIVTAVFVQQAEDVSADIDQWRTNWFSGTLFADILVCNNYADGTRMAEPFHYCVESNITYRLWHPDGTVDMLTGWPYVDISAQVMAGAGDGILDPGECVLVTNIEFYIRTLVAPAAINWEITALLLPPADKMDTDGDGIPDDWEQKFSPTLDYLFAPDARLDSDGDTHSNLDEHTANTDPTDINSYLRILTILRATGAGFEIEWPAATGRFYRIEGTPDAFQPYVPLQTGLPSTPPANVFTDTVFGTESRMFYRVEATLEP